MSATHDVLDRVEPAGEAAHRHPAPPGDTMDTTEADRRGSFDQPVPRQYVHRASISEVLLTNFVRDRRPDSFLVDAQWPRAHSFYRSRDGLHDALLMAETTRQVGLAIGHLGYDVPLDSPYIMQTISYDVRPGGLACGGKPTDLLLAASCYDIKLRRDQLVGLEYTVVFRRGQEEVGTGTASFTCTSPAAYRRMRGNAEKVLPDDAVDLPTAVAPLLVGRETTDDVVLSPAEGEHTWLLRCDPAHPVLFDHPVDHIPGILLTEAARQAVHHLLHPRPLLINRMSSEFGRFAEMNVPAEVRACPQPQLADGTTPVHISITQNGDSVAEITMHASPLTT